MENSSLVKQAKSDIFKELHPVISFYIKKGAKPKALKKYYKNSKRFADILDDIKNKGINLITDEKEYSKLVREVLYDILDDFIAKEKDDEYKNKQSKMKHIKEFAHFEDSETLNENIFSEIGRLADKAVEKVFSIFPPDRVKDLENRVENMSDDEKLTLLKEIEKKVKKWRVGRGLLGIVWFIKLIQASPIHTDPGFWMTRNELENLPTGLVIATICWLLSQFMLTRSEVIRDKVKDIFNLIKK